MQFLVQFSAVSAVHLTPKISVTQLISVQLMITRYSTDVEDFCVSVEFSAVSAVSAVKILYIYIF